MKNLVINNSKFTLVDKNEYEGKLTVWGKETIIFVDANENIQDIISLVSDKIKWINENKEKITRAFMEENNHYIEVINEMIENGEFKAERKINYDDFINSLFVNNVSLYLSDCSMMLDLEASPDYLFGHLASMEIDSDYKIECGGLNG